MHAEKRPRAAGAAGDARRRNRPRVVLFNFAGNAQVEIVELPEDADLGDLICHGGRSWRVTGVRTGARVLIAEPDAN